MAGSVSTFILSGSLTNTGTVAANTSTVSITGGYLSNNVGSFGSTVTNFIISGGTHTNAASLGQKAATMTISGGNLTNSGVLGLNATAVTINGGSVNITNSGTFTSGTNSTVNFSLGSIINTGTIGYQVASLTVSGASITNQGSLGLNAANIALSSGAFTIGANSQIGSSAGTVTISLPTVDNIATAQIGTQATNLIFSSDTILNSGSIGYEANSLILNVGSVTNLGSLGYNSSVTFSDNIFVINSGNLLNSSNGTITLSSGVFVNSGVFVSNGNLAQDNLKLVPSLTPESYLLFNKIDTSVEISSKLNLIIGKTPETQPIAQVLNRLNGKSSIKTQSIIQEVLNRDLSDREIVLKQLMPAFKIAQFSLEKLDLLLHKELDAALYTQEKGTVPFLIAGYDYLDQLPKSSYNGYIVNSYYQLSGLTYDFKQLKLLGGLGASESYMQLRPIQASAYYTTLYTTLGLSSCRKQWHYGLEALFGAGFLKGQRSIDFINKTATTSHNLYNISIDGKVVYKFNRGRVDFNLYEQIGYNYGHENAYTESGADGANQQVEGENLSVFRNALGFIYDVALNDKFKMFIDLSWMYENYLNNNNYQSAFEGTDVFGSYSQAIPTKNYIRPHAGFVVTHQYFSWQISYTGLYGKNFVESSASIKLSYKF